MADDFSLRYGDLLTGSYDCVDRIVLNAFFPLGYHPGGLRVWWRRWHDRLHAGTEDTRRSRAGECGGNIRAWCRMTLQPLRAVRPNLDDRLLVRESEPILIVARFRSRRAVRAS